MNKEEETKESTAVAVAQTTAIDVYDPGDDAGAGLQNITRDEMLIPFLRILQTGSPQCRPVNAGGVNGAKAGMLINMTTNEMYDGEVGVDFVPVNRQYHYVEWIPRNKETGGGGGFVGIRTADDPLVLNLKEKHGAFKPLPTSDGHEFVETYYLFGLLLKDGMTEPVVVGFSSTQIKKYRAFMHRVSNIKYSGQNGQLVQPAMFAHVWKLRTRFEVNKNNQSWYGWSISLKEEPPIKSRLKLSDPTYLQAKEIHRTIEEGRAVVKHEQREPGEDAAAGDEIPM